MNRVHTASPHGVALARPPQRASVARRLLRLPAALFEVLLVWQERAEQRARLRTMSDRMLKDIGLSRADAEREGAVPFWRPGHP